MTVLEPDTEQKPQPFGEVRIANAMHVGVLTCPVETPLRNVAHMMARYRVHCVVVFDAREETDSEGALWGVVSDLDLAAALALDEIEDRTAGGAAATPVVMVGPDETLARAAQLMTENSTAHLVVVEPESGRPVGVLSTLDLARIAAGSEATGFPRGGSG